MRLFMITTMFLLCTLKQALSYDQEKYVNYFDKYLNVNTVPNMVSDEKKYLIFTKGKLIGEWGGVDS